MSASNNVLPEYINHFLHFEKFAAEITKYEFITPEEAQKSKKEAVEALEKQLTEAKFEMSVVFSNNKLIDYNILVNAEIPSLEKKIAQAKADVYCVNDTAISFKKMAQQALYLWQTDNTKIQEKVRVAIIGDFSSGKSSFINSLLGESFCPVDVAASTSSITTFEYGDIKRIFCVDGDIKTEILLEDYNKLVTHQGKSGKKYQFEVFYPFDGFRDLELFDTPGFNNSNNNEDEKVTLQKCQLADVIFFVFDINKGDIGNDIKKKLLAIKEAKPSLQIHAIVNKSDQKPPVKIKEIERQLKQTGLFVDVVSYSSKKELDKYQLTSFNTVPNTLEHLSKQLTNANNSQWLIKKENAQIVVKALNQQLSEQRQIINSWFETIHKNNIKILQQRLEKQKQEYYEHGKHLLLKTSDSLDNYARAEAESVLPALKEFFELLGFFEDESGFFNFIKQKLKTHLEKETATMPVSNEEKSFIFSPFYKNVFYGFDSSYNRFNTKNEIYDDFLLALDEFYKRLNNMKAYFANHPTQLAHRCSIRLTEKLNDYTYKINTAFAGYYDNKEIAINHLRSIIDDNKFQDSHAMVISNIIFSALSDWYDDVRNYESNNKGYLSAKNEAALALKQQLDDFFTRLLLNIYKEDKTMTHNLLDSFQQKRNALLNAYQTLPQLGQELLELSGVSSQQLANWQHKLQEEHFTLCVAGQMNAGKSTLINALVFGRNVLPVYDTVMTSTITQIEHQSKHPQQQEGATVQFYSHNEWQQLKQQMQTNEALKQSFEEALNQAQLKGARAAELVGSPIRTLTGFENLSQYIAPLSKNKDGVYTPFVKQVTIYANNPLLKDLMVVDTPGINDPNEIRANLTETWIKNADAVLYVTYAGQALSKPDIDFIHRFMIHVPNTHRIIAINKIDCIDNPYQLDQWLLTLQNNQDSEAIKQIFSAKTPIVKVCALASLLENSQQPLDDESQWYKDDFTEKGYIGTGKHNMDELKKAISERILANKANGIISSHKQHIEGIFYQLLNALNNQKATHEQTLLDTAYNKKQLEQERAGLQDKQAMLSTKLAQLTKFTEEKVADTTARLEQEDNQLGNLFTQHLNTKLHDRDTYAKLKADAAWYIKQEFEDLICNKLVSTIKQETNQLKEQIDRRNQLLYQELKSLDILIDSKIELIFERAIYGNIQNIDIDTHTLSAKVASTISDNTWFLQRWLDKKIADVKALITSTARDELIKLIKGIVRDVTLKISDSTVKFTHEVEKNIRVEAEKRSEMLQQLLKHDVLLVNKQLEARQAIQQVEQHILTVKKIEQTISGY